MTSTLPPKQRRIPTLRLPSREERRARKLARRAEQTADATATGVAAPAIEIAPHDPLLAYLQAHPEPTDVESLKIDSPGVRALREAGVRMVVPLVTQGELIGVLNLGERLSEQEYSADDKKLLENLAGQAAPALRVAQLVREQEAEVRRRERYEQEMRVAQLIQQNFLPRELPDKAGWGVNAFYRPAREVGGDFYDFIELADGQLGVLVADVTDKGVPAALVMASTRSVLRSSAQRLIEPGVVLERVNDIISQDMPPNMFVTCVYGVLEPETGRFRFANAGHNLPCVQVDGGAVEVRATGMPLGLLSGMTYEENEVVIGPGRAFVLYSDAIPEAHAPDGEMFGFPQLIDIVGTSAGHSVIDKVLDALDRFTADDWEQEDDITIVAIQRSTTSAADIVGPDDEPDESEELLAFTIPSEPGNERPVMERVGEAVGALGLDEEKLSRLKTAVAEATMNAIEHGNANRADLHVEVNVLRTPHAITVRISDEGIGGPAPTDVDEPDIEAKLRGEQSPRGWGLFLIRNMVDEMQVFEDEDGHTVDLVMMLEATDE